MYKIAHFTGTIMLLQLRKMEKDRIAFVEEKKRKNLIKLKIIETLKAEQNTLRDRLNAIQDGPHAKRTLEVTIKDTI